MEKRVDNTYRFAHFTVELAVMSWGASDETSPPLDDYCLCQRLSGSRTPVRIENQQSHEALPRVRSVGFLPPGRALKLLPLEQPFHLLICNFEPGYFERVTGVTREQWDSHTAALVSVRNHRLEMLMQDLHAEIEQPGFAHTTLVESLASLMLVELARYAREMARRDPKTGAALALAPWQLARIHERIQASLELGYPKLEELAQLCGISRAHLMRAFKASTGSPLHQFISGERLKDARTLLANPELSCGDIASQLGYASASYFAAAFRRQTGLTPSAYRRQLRAPAHA